MTEYLFLPTASTSPARSLMVSLSPSGKAALDNHINSIIAEKKLPSLVCGVTTVDDEEIYFNCGGFNSVDDPSSGEVNRDSVFWICSQTKLVAHLAALQLIEKGKLRVDTPVSTYLPVFENPIILDDLTAVNPTFKPATKAVLVEHLLNMSSGLFHGIVNLPASYVVPHDEEDPIGHFYSLIMGDLPSLPLKFEPGTDFTYGYNSDTLGFIVEKITGQTLEAYCQENIFKPLGMTTASFYLTPELKAKAVNLNFPSNGKFQLFTDRTKIIEQDPSKVKLHLGGVGLYSSMKDYLILLRHVLQIKAGKMPPNPIVSAKTVQGIFTPSLPPSGKNSLDLFMATLGITPGNQWGSALALCTEDWPGRRKKGSAYWFGWAGTFGHIDTETGIAAVFSSQVVPFLDEGQIFQYYGEFEQILYSGLQ